MVFGWGCEVINRERKLNFCRARDKFTVAQTRRHIKTDTEQETHLNRQIYGSTSRETLLNRHRQIHSSTDQETHLNRQRETHTEQEKLLIRQRQRHSNTDNWHSIARDTNRSNILLKTLHNLFSVYTQSDKHDLTELILPFTKIASSFATASVF